MYEDKMEAKTTKPAENKDTMKDTAGNTVTEASGKPVDKPIEQADIAKAAATAATSDDEAIKQAAKALMEQLGIKDVDKALEGLKSYQKKEVRETAKATIEADKEKLRAAHGELKEAIFPILKKHGIEMTKGKRILIHGGVSDAELFDIAYPEALPDKGKGGGTRERKASPMGAVLLRIPELGIKDTADKPAAKSLSSFYKFWTGHGYEGFETGTQAVRSIGDNRDIAKTKLGDEGIFKVQNVAGVTETETAKGSDPYNIVSLTDKGYEFFSKLGLNITKNKLPAPVSPKALEATAKVEEPKAEAPAKIETPASAEAVKVETATPPAMKLPADWNQMSKKAKQEWRLKNQGQAS